MPSSPQNMLSSDQREYLDFVRRGQTSKQIAQSLGRSHHTINAEIAVAVRMLGARSRAEAAEMLARVAREDGVPPATTVVLPSHEWTHPQSYEPSYDPEALASAATFAPNPAHEEDRISLRNIRLPIPTYRFPSNTMTTSQRLMWILLIAAGVALLLGGLASGVVALLDSLRHWI